MQKLSDKFYTIKERHVIAAIIKSVVCGLSLGLFTVGVLLLSLKLSAIGLAAVYYALIGVGVAAIGGVLFFLLLFKPSDKYVAKRTDDDYALNERVQTALEYADRSGTLVELQREDAEDRIKSLPRLKPRFARIWQFGVAVLLASVMFITAIAVPAKASGEHPNIDDTPRQVTELELAGVRELIANIEASSLADELKTPIGAVLEQLLTDLNTVATEGDMSRVVNNAISKTEEIIQPTLSYLALGAALTDAEQIYLGQAITNGGKVYQYHMLTVYDEVRTFDLIKYDAANAKVGKRVTALRNDLTVTISAGLAELLDDVSNGIKSALASGGVLSTDGLYATLQTFADGLEQAKSIIASGADDTEVQNRISDLMTSLSLNAANELSTQAYNTAIKVFVSNRLKIIFGYSPLELPIVDTDKSDGGDDNTTPNPSDPSDPDVNPPGSGGTGEGVYGSDDMVWVPGRGYMKYGDIIEEYYNLINQYLHSDELTEEQKNMISVYYDILFGSGKNK